MAGKATSTAAETPKLGARAERRYADLEKELGKTKAKAVLTQATEIAAKKGDRLIRLEYLFDAQGVKMPAHAKSHYGRKSPVGSFDPEQAPPARKSSGAARAGRGNAKTATAGTKSKSRSKSKSRPVARKKPSPRPKSSANGSANSPQSKTAQMRALREAQASKT